MSNYKTLNFFNKTLLIFSAPFLPVMDYYLNRQLATAEKRQKLYLKTAGFFPFRVLAGYLLVKKYLKVLKQDRLTPYQGMAGFLYDLKNRMLNQTNKKWAIDSNYKFALGQVSDLIKKQDIKSA